jgi:DNA-directed RNA polymerase subunit RPC12/RpoP
MNYLCVACYGGHVDPERAKALIDNGHSVTCMDCGQRLAEEKAKRYTVAPMHKSNYMLITNREDLKGLNNKGGLIK